MVKALVVVMLLASSSVLAEEGKNDQQETLYAMGAILGHKLAGARLNAKELELVKRGFADAAASKKLKLDDPDLEEWGPRVEAMLAKRANPLVDAEKAKGNAFAAAAAKEHGAVQTPSGLVFHTLQAGTGTGTGPSATDKVKVNYEGKLIDGTVFDASIGSIARNQQRQRR